MQVSGDEAITSNLKAPILDPGLPLRELRAFVAARIPKFVPAKSSSEWRTQAESIRRDMLEKIIFRGEAARWRDAETRIEWLDTIAGDGDYVIRKFRYEALPGMWFPALLYEPKQLADKAPVFINVNGHDELGYATPEKQRRCINLAKRGILAFSFEFLYMNQLRDRGNRHNVLVQLDLCGTSGVAPFMLALFRGLDAALAHPHADATRVGVAGLSGGGWQSIMLASLDERITLANPVAGHGSIFARTKHSRDVGDSEQIPTDMCTIADYTHLTALVAPRPLLLTYNAKDDCCFLPESTLPLLKDAAQPTYALFGAKNRILTHINHDPGTHNFERDNREALYRLIHDFFYAGDKDYETTDTPVEESKLRSKEELVVPLPSDNATLNSLALHIIKTLPKPADPPEDRGNPEWRSAARERLRKIIRLPHYEARPRSTDESISNGGLRITRWKISLDDKWTVPAVEFVPRGGRDIAIVFSDAGRDSLKSIVEEQLAAGQRVLAVDPLAFGEAFDGIDAMELHMVDTVGERPLGIQVAQLAAVATWLRRSTPGESVKLVAAGPRASVIALVTAAVEPETFAEVVTQDSWASLKEFIHQNLQYKEAPEIACFGLLQEFDVSQLEVLAKSRPE